MRTFQAGKIKIRSMKSTIKLAQLQLSNLFFSPIPWLVLAAVIVQCSIDYLGAIEGLEGAYRLNRPLKDLTNIFFYAPNYKYNGVFMVIISSLFLYVPLVTMGSFSHERSSGSFRLLSSSPISSSQIVIGKFFGLLFYALIILLCLGIFICVTAFIANGLIYPWIFSGLLGLFLLMACYTAIGLFISSLSGYQVVSALITFLVLAVLSFIGGFFQSIPVLNDVAFWLSLNDRTEDFIGGLIKSQNVIYFVAIAGLFICWTIIRLEVSKRSHGLLKKVVLFFIPLLFTAFVAFVSSLPDFSYYLDVTDNKRNTVAENGRSVLSDLAGEKVEIVIYVNILDDNCTEFLPGQQNNDYRRFERYRRFLPQLAMTYVYFYDSTAYLENLSQSNEGMSLSALARKRAETFGLNFDKVRSPAEIKNKIDLSKEDNQTIRVFHANNRMALSRVFNGIFVHGSDADKIPAFKTLVKDPANIVFTKGHSERTPAGRNVTDFRKHFGLRHENANALLNKGFTVNTIDLSLDTISAIDDILVIADPKQPFEEIEIERIGNHVEAGGNMMLLAEVASKEVVDPILNMLNISIADTMLRQDHSDLIPELIFTSLNTSNAVVTSGFIQGYYLNREAKLTLNKSSYLLYDSSHTFEVTPFATFESDGTAVAPVITLTRKTNNRNQRIVVAADADFISAGEVGRRSVNNINDEGIIESIFYWLSNDEYPINSAPPPRAAGDIHFGDETGSLLTRLRWILFGVIPGLIIISATALLTYRHKR